MIGRLDIHPFTFRSAVSFRSPARVLDEATSSPDTAHRTRAEGGLDSQEDVRFLRAATESEAGAGEVRESKFSDPRDSRSKPGAT